MVHRLFMSCCKYSILSLNRIVVLHAYTHFHYHRTTKIGFQISYQLDDLSITDWSDIFSSPEQNAQVSYCRPFSSVVRRPSSVNFLHFHLLLENAWLDFNQTWQESSLGVGDSKLFKSYVWPPWGPRGRAPKGQNHANFKHLLLQIQKENGQVM